jgi:hypothetical protein
METRDLRVSVLHASASRMRLSHIVYQALMKSFSVNGSDPIVQEKFLAYIFLTPHEVPVPYCMLHGLSFRSCVGLSFCYCLFRVWIYWICI